MSTCGRTALYRNFLASFPVKNDGGIVGTWEVTHRAVWVATHAFGVLIRFFLAEIVEDVREKYYPIVWSGVIGSCGE